MKDFFKDANGDLSMGRLLSFLSAISGILLIVGQGVAEIVGLLEASDPVAGISLIAAAVAGKVGQKFAELKK